MCRFNRLFFGRVLLKRYESMKTQRRVAKCLLTNSNVSLHQSKAKSSGRLSVFQPSCGTKPALCCRVSTCTRDKKPSLHGAAGEEFLHNDPYCGKRRQMCTLETRIRLAWSPWLFTRPATPDWFKSMSKLHDTGLLGVFFYNKIPQNNKTMSSQLVSAFPSLEEGLPSKKSFPLISMPAL